MIKKLISICFIFGLLVLPIRANDETPMTVVEMFTSQGCGGCIPASAYLEVIRERPGIIALSWPVDYLDRFGWKDTLADESHAERQKNYNKRFGRGGLIYTPEMVIDGRVECIGHDAAEANNGIKNMRAINRVRANPKLSIKGDILVISLPKAALEGAASVHLAWYVSDAMVDIGDGENKGTVMHAINVVRKSEWIGTWDGSVASIKVPLSSIDGLNVDHAAVILHDGPSNGAIVGAGKIALTSGGATAASK